VVLVSGIAVVDLIASGLPRPAGPGELVFGSVRFSLGGHACNVSTDLAQLGFPKARLRVVFPAGRDMFGRFLVDSLKRKGLRAEAVLTREAPTSLDLIIVAKGEDRRYHADPGANVVMPPERVLALLERYRPRLFYAGGVGLLNRVDARLAAVLKKARSVGAATFVDVVSPYRQTWDFLRKGLPWTDFFHCNSDEASDLTGERDAGKALKKIIAMGARHVFLTMGERGVLAGVPGAVLRVPAFSVNVIDPTGAGDAFSAGLIRTIEGALARRLPAFPVDYWKAALVYASACGAACCTGIGTTASVSAANVEKLMRRQARAVLRGVTVQTR
jgi:sugar/nucleoside kinase (ribokinase family)